MLQKEEVYVQQWSKWAENYDDDIYTIVPIFKLLLYSKINVLKII